MKIIGQRTWHVLPNFQNRIGVKTVEKNLFGTFREAENVSFGKQRNFVGQWFMNLVGGCGGAEVRVMKNCIM